jgi:anti-sigma factor RsiW
MSQDRRRGEEVTPVVAGCAEIRQALGVYVLGAIDPAERAVVDRHIASCTACRDELAGLAALPALLGRVSLDEVDSAVRTAGDPAQPPPALLRSMLTELARRRRARRLRVTAIVAAAAAVVLAVAGIGVRNLVSGQAGRATVSPSHSVVIPPGMASATDRQTHVTAVVKLWPQDGVTALSVWEQGIRYGAVCQLYAIDRQGHRHMAGGWRVAERYGDAWYPASTELPMAKLAALQIVSGNKPLVTIPVR